VKKKIEIDRRLLAATLAGAVASSGCAAEVANETDEDEQAIEVASQDLYYRTSTLWNARSIPVCWEPAVDGTPHTADKALVQAAVLGQRSWVASGNVRFYGWAACPAGSFQGIRITPGSSNVTDFGQMNNVVEMELDFTASPSYARCSHNSLGRSDCITATALHEFGHALSIDHEHNRSLTDCAQDSPTGDATYGPYDAKSIMTYCNPPADLSVLDRLGVSWVYGRKNRDNDRHVDFNGDKRADLLCHDVVSGGKATEWVSGSAFTGTQWSTTNNWCSHINAVLLTGDFNGDGRADLLCSDAGTGYKWIDYADASGRFGGTDWQRNTNWCSHATAEVYIGDFNGDKRDDLLCHDTLSGYKWIDYADASGAFNGTDWERANNWCIGRDQLFVGDFNGDLRDDILCHAPLNGTKWIDYADASGRFFGTDWSRAANWCLGEGEILLIGDANHNGRDDIICHNGLNGNIHVDLAETNGVFSGTDWASLGTGWCSHNSGRISMGDFNGDGHDDLLCHDTRSGQKWVDLASASGTYLGTDIWSGSAWCGTTSGELH
jgi:hypothetical protein